MKKYARISGKFIAEGAFGSLENDANVGDELNKKLNIFLKKEDINLIDNSDVYKFYWRNLIETYP